MNPNELVPGKTFATFKPINVCFYDADDCQMPNAVNLPSDYDLTYVGPDPDGGHIFLTDEAEKVCLHDDDLLYINFADTTK